MFILGNVSLSTGGGGGVPHSADGDNPLPRRQKSRAKICYVVSGMPLALTQEDFLVAFKFEKQCSGLACHAVGYLFC